MKLTTLKVPTRTREHARRVADSRRVFRQDVVDLLLYAWELAPEDVRNRAQVALACGGISEVGEKVGSACGSSVTAGD